MSTKEIAKKLVELCKAGRGEECKAFYSADVVSVEAGAPPGGERVAKGLDAVRAKGKWWADNHVVHGQEVFGPYPHGDDRFAVRFVYDVTNKPSGKRFTMDEVGVFHVANDRIVREEFFYGMD